MRLASGALALFLLLWPLSAPAATEQGLILQTSPLAGFQYHAGRALFPLMQVGDRLQLYREPDNPHDARAVRVDWRGAMIGYAPRADNVDLARLMDQGTRVEGRILHLQKSRDPWKRVLFEVLVVDALPSR
jgi:hypothetical protein